MNKYEDDYFKKRNLQNTERLRNVLSQLPMFVSEFFVGIQMRTTALTRLNYAYDLRVFFHYLSIIKYRKQISMNEIVLEDLNQLRALDIELFIEFLSNYEINGKNYICNENGKERKLATLRSFFHYFFKKDKLNSDVCVKVDFPKLHEKPIVRLENDEVSALLKAVESGAHLSIAQLRFHGKTHKRDTAILSLFLGTGIRISELVGMNKNDIDFHNNSFLVTRKGGNKSILYFSNEVGDALKAYLEWLENEKMDCTDFGNKISKNETPLFYSVQGKRISVRAVELLVKKYAGNVTPLKKITPHKLRSTYGTALYRATRDIYMVADVLGHSDINTTKKHYAAMSDEIRRQAADAVQLNPDYKASKNAQPTDDSPTEKK